MFFSKIFSRSFFITFFAIIISLSLITSLSSCGNQNADSKSDDSSSSSSSEDRDTLGNPIYNSFRALDYSQGTNWLSRPKSTDPKLDVDIFVYYPTAYDGNDDFQSALDDQSNKNAKEWLDQIALPVIGGLGNVYVPYYRQCSTSVLKTKYQDQLDRIGKVTMPDAKQSFEYYFGHMGDLRPFVLFADSQGAMILLNMLEGYFAEHRAAYAKMIAAYVIGYSVTRQDLINFPHLKFAQGPDDTGVIISYNTESENISGENPVVREGAIAINPLNWKTDGTKGEVFMNLGTLMDGTKNTPIADARVDVDRGVVITSVNAKDYEFGDPFPSGSLHKGDIPLYAYNLRQNIQDRIAAFLKANPPQAQ